MVRTNAESTIAKLRESWSRWGIPKQVVTDNGPPYTSKQFAEFLKSNGVYHAFTAPYHPASNGAAENAVKLIKNVIKKARHESVDPELAIQRFLLVYHNTPHCTTGESPAQMLQGRRLRTRLDAVRPGHGSKVRNKELEAVEKTQNSRQLTPGDQVWCRNFGENAKWVEGQVIERLGRANYSVDTGTGSAAHRHIDQLKRRSTCVFPSEGGGTGGTGGVGTSERPSLEPQSVANGGISPEVSPISARARGRSACPESPVRTSPSTAPTNTLPSTGPGISLNITPTQDKSTPKRNRRPVVRYGLETK